MHHPLHNDYNPRYWRWYTHWLDPRNYWREAKYFWQRGTRGWADCDVWSMDGHLCDIIVPMLQQLRENKLGFPESLITAECPEEQAAGKWDGMLEAMIKGFTAGRCIISDEGAEGFFGPGPEEGEDFMDYIKKPSQFDSEGYKAWQAERQAEFHAGMKLFHEFFFGLWD